MSDVPRYSDFVMAVSQKTFAIGTGIILHRTRKDWVQEGDGTFLPAQFQHQFGRFEEFLNLVQCAADGAGRMSCWSSIQTCPHVTMEGLASDGPRMNTGELGPTWRIRRCR
jgi:hypothetical protein